MKHLCLNLKRFDVPVEMGGVNRLTAGNVWAETIVSGTKEGLEQYRGELERYNQPAQTGHRPRLVVGGRLGEYKYYDMDQSIAKALELEL